MELNERTIVLSTVIAASILVAGMIVYGAVQKRPGGFAELYILGENHSAHPKSYPNRLYTDRVSLIYLGVINHLGRVELFKIEVKIWNSTEGKAPFNTRAIYSQEFVVEDGGAWESPFYMMLEDVKHHPVSAIREIWLNDLNIRADTTSEDRFRMIFELYIYNESMREYEIYQMKGLEKAVWVQFWFEID